MFPRKDMVFDTFKVNEYNHKIFDYAYLFTQGNKYPLLMILGEFDDVYHLRYAVVNELGSEVVHLNMDEWNDQLVHAIKTKNMQEFNSRMINLPYMVISDIEELEDKESTEMFFMDLLKERIELGHPTLLLSKLPGKKLVEKVGNLCRYAAAYKVVKSETH